MTEKLKIGRPALNLSPEEKKERNKELREKRIVVQRQALRQLAVETLVSTVLMYGKNNREKAIKKLMTDSRWDIRFDPTKEPKLAGYNGERLSRQKQDEAEV